VVSIERQDRERRPRQGRTAAKGDPPSEGRRARKKAATRAAIADAALSLFLEHGYEAVSIRQIAETADVSVATVFVHFPSKEALIFDEDADFGSGLVAAVTGRPAGQDLLSALEAFANSTAVARYAGTAEFDEFRALVDRTPELRAFGRQTWTRHAGTLADAIIDDAARRGQPVDRDQASVLGRFVLESLDLASVSPDPRRALAAAFALLRQGWSVGQ
jgi:AcrR family transcriptional regulator